MKICLVKKMLLISYYQLACMSSSVIFTDRVARRIPHLATVFLSSLKKRVKNWVSDFLFTFSIKIPKANFTSLILHQWSLRNLRNENHEKFTILVNLPNRIIGIPFLSPLSIFTVLFTFCRTSKILFTIFLDVSTLFWIL